MNNSSNNNSKSKTRAAILAAVAAGAIPTAIAANYVLNYLNADEAPLSDAEFNDALNNNLDAEAAGIKAAIDDELGETPDNVRVHNVEIDEAHAEPADFVDDDDKIVIEHIEFDDINDLEIVDIVADENLYNNYDDSSMAAFNISSSDPLVVDVDNYTDEAEIIDTEEITDNQDAHEGFVHEATPIDEVEEEISNPYDDFNNDDNVYGTDPTVDDFDTFNDDFNLA